MPNARQKRLDDLMARSLGNYIDDYSYNGVGEISYGDPHYGAETFTPTESPYLDDFALGQTKPSPPSPADFNAEVDANQMLLWGGLAIAAFLFFGPK